MRVDLSSKLAILAICGAVTVSATGCAGSGSWGAPTNMFAWGKSDAADMPEPPSVGSRPTATATAANTSAPQISIPDSPTGPPAEGPPGGGPGGIPAGGYAATNPENYGNPTGDTGPIGGRAGVSAQAGMYAATRPDAPAGGGYGAGNYTADARNAAGGNTSPGAYRAPTGNGGFAPGGPPAGQPGGYPPAAGGYPTGGYPTGNGYPSTDAYPQGNAAPGTSGGYPATQQGYQYPSTGGDYSSNSTRNPNSQASQELLGKAGAPTGPGANYDNTSAIGDSPAAPASATGGMPPASLLQAKGGFRPGSTNVAGLGGVAPADHQQAPQARETVRQAAYDNAPATNNGGQFQPQGGSFMGGNF